MNGNHKYEIFLSYSHVNEVDGRLLAKKFRENGLRCFLADQSIRAGENWELTLRDALSSSERIVILVTKESVQSSWVNVEIGAAWAMGKEIVPALWKIKRRELKSFLKEKGYEDHPISRHQWIEIDPTNIENFVGRINPEEGTPGILKSIFGLWTTRYDDDNVFFFQKGERFVGFFNHGGDNDVVGIYLGDVHYPEALPVDAKELIKEEDEVEHLNPRLEFDWMWCNGALRGKGGAILKVDIDAVWTISGEWSYEDEERQSIYFRYQWVSSAMPSWVSPDDIMEYLDFINGSRDAQSFLEEKLSSGRAPLGVPLKKRAPQSKKRSHRK